MVLKVNKEEILEMTGRLLDSTKKSHEEGNVVGAGVGLLAGAAGGYLGMDALQDNFSNIQHMDSIDLKGGIAGAAAGSYLGSKVGKK